MAKAMLHYPTIARKHDMVVVMANSVGPSDDFISAGQSAAWDSHGQLLAQMDGESEGLVVVDVFGGKARMHGLAAVDISGREDPGGSCQQEVA